MLRIAAMVAAFLVAGPAGIYLWNPAVALVAGFQVAALASGHSGSGPGDCTGRWSPPVDARIPYLAPLFPETAASYRVMFLPAGGEYAVEARPVQARHASLQVYDADSGAILESHDAVTSPLALALRPERAVALVWRIYLGAEEAALPNVRLTSADGRPCKSGFALPSALLDPARAQARRAALERVAQHQRALAAAGDPSPVRFFARRPANEPFLANAQAIYAFALLDPALGDAAHFAFRPPAAGDGGVRYWSVCLSGLRETSTSQCMHDAQIAVGADGLAHFAVGDARIDGPVNRFGWGWFTGRRVVIVRQLFGPGSRDFPGSFEALPEFDAAGDLDALSAHATLGDRGPSGRYCSAGEPCPYPLNTSAAPNAMQPKPASVVSDTLSLR